jgi:hypothetical protein
VTPIRRPLLWRQNQDKKLRRLKFAHELLQRLFRVAEDHGRVDTGRVVRKQHDWAAIAVLDKTLFAVTVDKPFR